MAAASTGASLEIVTFPREQLIPVEYPPDASNYIWSVEESLDMKNWHPLLYPTTGPAYDARCRCITNQVYFIKWTKTTNEVNFDVHMGTNRVVFWRLHGFKQ